MQHVQTLHVPFSFSRSSSESLPSRNTNKIGVDGRRPHQPTGTAIATAEMLRNINTTDMEATAVSDLLLSTESRVTTSRFCPRRNGTSIPKGKRG